MAKNHDAGSTFHHNEHGFVWRKSDGPGMTEDLEREMRAAAVEASAILDAVQGKVPKIMEDPHLNVPGKRDRLFKLARESHDTAIAPLDRRMKALESRRDATQRAIFEAIVPRLSGEYITADNRAAAQDRANAEVRADLRTFASAHPIDGSKLMRTSEGGVGYEPGDPVGALLDAASIGDIEHAKRLVWVLREITPTLRSLLGGDVVFKQMERDVIRRAAPEHVSALRDIEALEATYRMFRGTVTERVRDLTGMDPRNPDVAFAEVGAPGA